jgi:hypothetical protein
MSHTNFLKRRNCNMQSAIQKLIEENTLGKKESANHGKKGIGVKGVSALSRYTQT